MPSFSYISEKEKKLSSTFSNIVLCKKYSTPVAYFDSSDRKSHHMGHLPAWGWAG